MKPPLWPGRNEQSHVMDTMLHEGTLHDYYPHEKRAQNGTNEHSKCTSIILDDVGVK